MHKAAKLTAVACLVAVLGIVVTALAQRNSESFTLGVSAAIPAAELQPGAEACQTPIVVPPGGAFDRVVVKLGTYGQPGPATTVEIRDAASHRPLSTGKLAPGYADITRAPTHSVRVDEVPAGRRIEVCVANHGDRRVAVYGNADAAARTSSATLDGKPTGTDLTLDFRRSSRSVASMLGDIAGRASLFKAGWTGAWTFWLLGLLVLVAVPVLLVQAVRTAQE
jgi:hypothetical protein